MAKNTKQTDNRVLRVIRVDEARWEENQILAFTPRDFVLCGLPYRAVKEKEYERKNGNFSLRVVGDPRFGIPYGQDRLVAIWLATAFRVAREPADNIIRFRSVRDILNAFDLGIGGRQMHMLRQRLARMFNATFFTKRVDPARGIQRFNRYQLISGMQLWFSDKAHVNQYSLWANVIQLDANFANDLRKSSVPIDIESIKALKSNPSALDLYVWQAWRSWRLASLKRDKPPEIEIPIFGEMGLLSQLGSQAKEPKKARELLQKAQDEVRGVWRECPNQLCEDVFVIRSGLAVQQQKALLELPGVSPNPPAPKSPPKSAEHLVVYVKDPSLLTTKSAALVEDNPVDKP